MVPLDRLGEAIDGTLAIGARHGLETCSWGHAGDGNIHSTFLVSPLDEDELRRADEAAGELFDLAVRLGGSISGEHGVGWEKRGRLASQWAPRALDLHEQIKRAFDRKGLLNPAQEARPPALSCRAASAVAGSNSSAPKARLRCWTGLRVWRQPGWY